jgi:phosphoribosylglycinamide formyltransferase-1
MNQAAGTADEGIGDGLKTVVLISGGGTNLQAIINQVVSGDLRINLQAVISDRPNILGLDRADKAGVPTRCIDYSTFADRETAEQALMQALDELDPQLVVLAGFMRILPASLVSQFSGRMLNIHPSLLPKFKGLQTYRRAIEAGETWHGSTVHFVTPELDAGPSILQYRVRLHPDETEDGLAARVQQGEYLIYPQAIGWIADRRLRLERDELWLDGLPLNEPVIVKEP